MAVVGAVAAITDRDPLDMEPLQYTIDTKALNQLLSEDTGPKRDLEVRFSLDEYSIVVDDGGCLEIYRGSQATHD
jgi:hypothetical protein